MQSTVIGGANLMGGAGTAFGAVVGSAFLEVIRNALLMAGIDSNWQGAFVGAFIVLAVLLGKQTGGNYMGQPPRGQEINVQWFSIVKFKDEKIIRIFSIADVLGMMISVGVIDPSVLPVDPYK